MKTIAELIEELQKLDQTKPIWVNYDQCDIFPPLIETITEEDLCISDELTEGDYVINVW